MSSFCCIHVEYDFQYSSGSVLAPTHSLHDEVTQDIAHMGAGIARHAQIPPGAQRLLRQRHDLHFPVSDPVGILYVVQPLHYPLEIDLPPRELRRLIIDIAYVAWPEATCL